MTIIPCVICYRLVCDCLHNKSRKPWIPPDGANGTTMLLLEHAAKIESLAQRVENLEKRSRPPRGGKRKGRKK